MLSRFLGGSQQGVLPASVFSALRWDCRTSNIAKLCHTLNRMQSDVNQMQLEIGDVQVQMSKQSRVHVIPGYQSSMIGLPRLACTTQVGMKILR